MVNPATIDPTVNSGTFGEKLLHICYTDTCDVAVSLQAEQVLCEPSYHLHTATNSHQVFNPIGDASLLAFFQTSRSFRSILDVFADVERRELANLRILREAQKSARTHNFLGCYSDVHAALLTLHSVELPLVLEDASEVERIRLFREETGLEISKDTPITLQDPLYKKQRLFKIPEYEEKQLFEWHVKIGNHTRIHYFIDKPNGIVYVGHCGKHLGINSYHS